MHSAHQVAALDRRAKKSVANFSISDANIKRQNMAGITPKWVAEHGAEIGVDGSRIAFVNSVGGDMAAALLAA